MNPNSYLNRSLLVARIAMSLAIASAAVCWALAGWEMRQIARAARPEVPKLVADAHTTLSQVRDSSTAIQNSAANVETQVVLLRGNVASAVTNAETDLSTRWQETNGVLLAGEYNLVQQLYFANQTLRKTSKDIGAVTNQAAQIESQISSGLQQFIPCEKNPACLYSRWAAGSKAVIDTLGTIDKEAPRLANSLDRMASSGAGIAHSADVYVSDFTKPRSFPKKIWDFSGAVIKGCSRFC